MSSQFSVVDTYSAGVLMVFVGAPGLTSRALERTYYPAIGSSNSSVGAVPTVPSSGSATFANGGYAPRTVHGGSAPTYPHPAPAASSVSRAMPHGAVIRSYPPATSAATSTSIRIAQPLPARTAASSRHASNGRNRRARSSYYALHPLMLEAEVDNFSFLFHIIKLKFVKLETDLAAVCEAVYDAGPVGLLRIKSSSS